jgi:hypothetical protein
MSQKIWGRQGYQITLLEDNKYLLEFWGGQPVTLTRPELETLFRDIKAAIDYTKKPSRHLLPPD